MGRRATASAALQPDLFAQDVGAVVTAKPTILRTVPRSLGNGTHSAPAALPPALDEADMVRHLERTGRYRILRQLLPRPVRPLVGLGAERLRIGIILDTETTGLDHAMHEVIELGMVALTYDDSAIQDVVGVFSALREPAQPITPEITRITGITSDMVRGHGGLRTVFPACRPIGAFERRDPIKLWTFVRHRPSARKRNLVG